MVDMFSVVGRFQRIISSLQHLQRKLIVSGGQNLPVC